MNQYIRNYEPTPYNYDDTKPVYESNLRMGIAMDVARQVAFIAGMVDGEDSSGRSKARIMTPQEVAERACSIADAMVTEFETREWIRPVSG